MEEIGAIDFQQSDIDSKREDTRSEIARIYIYGFFCIIAFGFATYWFYGPDAITLKDILLTISAILSGPLGFIIGYYFKSMSAKS